MRGDEAITSRPLGLCVAQLLLLVLRWTNDGADMLGAMHHKAPSAIRRRLALWF